MGFTAVAQIKLIGGLYLDAELPFAYGSYSVGVSDDNLPDVSGDFDLNGFTIGNPTIGAHYAFSLSPDIAAFAGASVSIPVASDPSSEASTALLLTLPARAYFDTHRLLPETLSIRPRGGVEVRILPMLHYRGDLGLTVAIPTGDGGLTAGADRDTEIIIEQGNELELRAPMGFGGGLRLQEAFLTTQNGGSDVVQTAIEPFVGYEPSGAGLYARAGLLVALDEQLGFGLDEGKVATLRLSVGGKF
jgi:hypothetical protein